MIRDRHEHLLLAEDDAIFAGAMARALRARGFEVDIARMPLTRCDLHTRSTPTVPW